ncbi:hypothetical protein BV20DRAFT_967870 [Pilatotrama ljubarskyi]|nr:hypothetical protein BV20DRAFT_967870 [Pilatotrama ljubarskyi]
MFHRISRSVFLLAIVFAIAFTAALPTDTTQLALLTTLDELVAECIDQSGDMTSALVERLHSCLPGDTRCTCLAAIYDDRDCKASRCASVRCRLPEEALPLMALAIFLPKCAAYAGPNAGEPVSHVGRFSTRRAAFVAGWHGVGDIPLRVLVT